MRKMIPITASMERCSSEIAYTIKCILRENEAVANPHNISLIAKAMFDALLAGERTFLLPIDKLEKIEDSNVRYG